MPVGAPLGNQNGTKKQRQFGEALDRAIAQDDGKRLRATAEKLLDLAAEGEPWAAQMLADRLDGKAAQAVSLTADLKVSKATDLSDDELAAIASHASGDSA